MPDDLKTQIEEQLAPLIGLRMFAISHSKSHRQFYFGESLTAENTVSPEYILEPVTWRLENDREIITGSVDLQLWKYNLAQPEKWDFNRGGSLQDVRLAAIFVQYDNVADLYRTTTDQLVVEQVAATRYGDVTLHLSGGYRLVLFPTSHFGESWELRDTRSNTVLIIGHPAKDRGFDPVTAPDFIARAEIRYWIDDIKGAIADCTEAIRLDPQNSMAYAKRGYYLDSPEVSDDRAEAVADYAEAIRLDPRNYDAYVGRAMIYEWDREDFRAAIADYTEALQIEPNSRTYVSLGFCHWQLDENEAAIADYTQALELEDMNYVDGYVGRARSRHELGDPIGALADMDTALRLEPGYSSLYEKRGNIRYDLEDLDGALSDYNRALELQPINAEALNSRAWVFYAKQDYARALIDASQAIEKDRAWEYLYTRGLLYAAQLDTTRAISDFQAALDKGADDEDAVAQMRAYITYGGNPPDDSEN